MASVPGVIRSIRCHESIVFSLTCREVDDSCDARRPRSPSPAATHRHAFPTGAFAHSFGLETYVARGAVNSAAKLEAFVTNTLLHAIAPSDGVACRAAAQAGTDWEDIVQRLDHRLSAMKTVTEFRQASQSLGTRFLRTTTQLYTLPRASYLSVGNRCQAGAWAYESGLWARLP